MTDLDRTPPTGFALPPAPGLIRPARAARFVASLLILVATGVAVVVTWQSWRTYQLVKDILAGAPSATAERAATAERVTGWLSWTWVGAVVVAGVAFAGWLWRARVNSARLCDAPQRIRWSVLSWFVPLANLWWPQMVVGDVWRASRPDVPARGADLRDVPPSKAVAAWWATFLAMHAVDLYAANFLADGSTEAAFRTVFVTNAVSAGLACVSAGLALWLMWRIDRWQTGQPAVR